MAIPEQAFSGPMGIPEKSFSQHGSIQCGLAALAGALGVAMMICALLAAIALSRGPIAPVRPLAAPARIAAPGIASLASQSHAAAERIRAATGH